MTSHTAVQPTEKKQQVVTFCVHYQWKTQILQSE